MWHCYHSNYDLDLGPLAWSQIGRMTVAKVGEVRMEGIRDAWVEHLGSLIWVPILFFSLWDGYQGKVMLESASNLGKTLMIKKPTPDPHTSLLPSPGGSASMLTLTMWARGYGSGQHDDCCCCSPLLVGLLLHSKTCISRVPIEHPSTVLDFPFPLLPPQECPVLLRWPLAVPSSARP